MNKPGGTQLADRNRWSDYGGHLPTSLRGTDHAVSLLVIGVRLGTLLQMAPSLPQGVSVSPRPALYLTCWITAALCTIGISWLAFRQGRPPSQRVFAVDLVLAIALTVAGSWAVTDAFRIGSWVAPYSGHLLGVAVTGATVLLGRRRYLVVLAAVVVAQQIFVAPVWDTETASTIIGNALTLLVIPLVGRWIYQYLRRVAADGDRAKSEAQELGRREEERRAQVAIHNGAAVIQMLSDPSIDPATRTLLEQEARLESARIQSYLRGRGDGDTVVLDHEQAAPLSRVVNQTCNRFLDLPIHATLDLASDAIVPAEAVSPLDRALASILLNIRNHARAETVVVHADHEAGEWVVTLHDDGVGFEVDPQALGVGLREVVIGELARHDIEASIESTPGTGTTVTLRGRSDAP